MIPLTKPYYDDRELQEISKVAASGWLAQGPKCEEFEKEIEKILKVKHAIALSSCTAALYLSLRALGIGEGDEVIVPSFTFPATALSILQVGAIPVFVDVGRDYNIVSDQITEAITDKTKAIMPVHQFGRPCEMVLIMEIANYYNLKVIEDAACALGASIFNRKVGTFGDIGCFSLHARKIITTGEGGIVITDDDDLARIIRRESCFGVERAFKRIKPPLFTNMGFNFKMSDIQAAIGLVQLSKLDEIIGLRKQEKRRWDAIIKGDSFLNRVLWPQEETPSYMNPVYQSYVRSICSSSQRARVVGYFLDKGFETGVGTFACHLQPVFCGRSRIVGGCNLSWLWSEQTISLPIFPGLNLLQQWRK